MVTANTGAVAVPHTPLDQENFILHYKILIIHRSFNTQFNKFFVFFLSLVHLLLLNWFHHFSSFSSCSSLNCSGTRHSALQDRLISSASLPNFLLKRCFSSKPNFVSTEFVLSGLKVVSLILYASNAG